MVGVGYQAVDDGVSGRGEGNSLNESPKRSSLLLDFFPKLQWIGSFQPDGLFRAFYHLQFTDGNVELCWLEYLFFFFWLAGNYNEAFRFNTGILRAFCENVSNSHKLTLTTLSIASYFWVHLSIQLLEIFWIPSGCLRTQIKTVHERTINLRVRYLIIETSIKIKEITVK